jgi:hypothetical protein
MSEKEIKSIVKSYIKDVKKALPDWLTNKKDEMDSILSELEEHLWFKAEEISETGGPTAQSVRLAISSLGTPKSIASEYKRRGEPYMYITKELWPYYKKVLIILFAVITVINVIGYVLNILSGDFSFDIAGLLVGFFATFTLITIIFVALSKEGYLPEDFKSQADIKKEQKELKKAEELGMPISPKTGKPLKPFIQTTEKIIGGPIAIVIGFLLITFPFPIRNAMNSDFLIILALFGVLVLIEGIFTLTRGILGNSQPLTHQIILSITIVLELIAVPLVVILWNDPTIIQIFWIQGSQLVLIPIPAEYIGWAKIILMIIIVIQLLSIIEPVYNIVKLEKYKALSY